MKKEYTDLYKALVKQITSSKIPTEDGGVCVLFNIGTFKQTARVSDCALAVGCDKKKELSYQCLKAKQRLVRDVLITIYGDDWRLYETH